MKRNLSIDLVKGIAMFMVLALHMHVYRPFGMIPSYVYGICGIAIPLFFMVSGYLMYGKLVDYQYIKRKLGGVIKFVYITITIFLLIEYLNGRDFHYRTYGSWIVQKGYFWHYWYFASMLFIYIMSPLLSKLMKSKYFEFSILLLVVLCSLAFFLDYAYNWEQKYVKQTFRIWYWIFYFLIGGCIHKYQGKIPELSWYIALCALCIHIVIITLELFGSMTIEYYFGSASCILASICIFIACLSTRIEGKISIMFVSELSKLFLPVYALHTFLIKSGTIIIGIIPKSPHITIFVNYIGICVSMVIISMVVMRIPYVNKIFKL